MVTTIGYQPVAALRAGDRLAGCDGGRCDATVADLFHQRALVCPRATAMIDPLGTGRSSRDGPAISYGELRERVNRVALHLQLEGVGAPDVVTVRADRPVDRVANLLGVLSAGGTYLAVDPGLPAGPATELADRTGPRLRLDPDVQPLPPLIDSRRPILRQAPDSPEVAVLVAQDLDLVELEHRSLRHLVTALGVELGGGPTDRWLVISGPAEAESLPSTLLPLVVGAQVMIAGPEQASDGETLLEVIRRTGVTHLAAPGSTWLALLDAGFDEPDTAVGLVYGGQISLELARRLRARVRRLSTMYGYAETGIWSITCPIPNEPESLPLGRPMSGVSACLLDDQLREVPVGEPGEIVLGGPGIARGYRDNPGRTAERFRSVPCGGPGLRWFATGEVGRRLPCGLLEHLGQAGA